MANPTNLEQETLELINRFRMDPTGEFNRLTTDAATRTAVDTDVTNAIRFFKVDMTLLAQQFAALSPVAPLAWNTQLEDAAALHSAAMITANSQSHQLPGELGLGDRVKAAGYNFAALGENVFAFAESVLFGHAGFVIDWGNTPTGIQTPPGHRNNLMSTTFTEIGIDITPETNAGTKVGPLVTTHDLGTTFTYKAQLLGVVFTDADKDAFYDAGEGVGGVTVTAIGTPGTFTTTTWSSGGYQMQAPQGTYTVSFSGGGMLAPQSKQVTIGAANVKLDVNTTVAPPPGPPSIPDLVAGSDMGSSSTDNVTNDTTPTFAGSAELGTSIVLLAGGKEIGSGTTDGLGNWTVTTSALAQGTHGVSARSTNAKGTVFTSAETNVVIDTTAPATPGVPDLGATFDTGTSTTDNLTKASTPVLSGTTEANATITLFEGGTALGSGKANGAGAWTAKSKTLADGAHTITARATDLAGNDGALSVGLTVTIDTTDPVAPSVPNMVSASDTGRSDVDNNTKLFTPVFGGTGTPGLTVTLFAAGVARGSAKVNAGGAWSLTSSVLPDGVYAVTVRQSDAAGNTGAFSPTISVTIDSKAPSAPVITAASLTTLTGTAEAKAIVDVFKSGTKIGSATTLANGTWSLAITLGAGDHSLTAQGTDTAGNTSALSAARTARLGTAAANTLTGGAGIDLMAGAGGDDSYAVNDAGDQVTEAAGEGNDAVVASVGYALGSTARVEFLTAAAGAGGLALTGNGFANAITGGDGADTLRGGGGLDTLKGGKAGDVFNFVELKDSTVGLTARDTITDFSLAEGDRIGLAAIDANTLVANDQAFTFVGSAAFTKVAGELRSVVGGGTTTVSGDVTGDGFADFAITLNGSITLAGANFVL